MSSVIGSQGRGKDLSPARPRPFASLHVLLADPQCLQWPRNAQSVTTGMKLAKNTPGESSKDSGSGTTSSGNALGQDEFLSGLRKEGKSRVIGPVRLQSRISKGGMGIVYRGRHVKLDIDVAVKFLLPNLAEDNPEYVVRFEREAKIAAQLNNENLVRVFDVDSEKNYHYVVMELVCGETARDRVARKGPLSEHEAVEIILGATRGLEAAHRKGIVHRDIKPENIMIDATGIVKLADLGIAKIVDGGEGGKGHGVEANLTQPGFVMGTPSFMPPEQLTDSSSVGFAGDIYSMGATLYFLLTGKPPYVGNIYEIVRTISVQDFPDVREARPGLSDRVVDILRSSTARDPKARLADATALLRALETSGTERRSLEDLESGTVTAVARVSTPPARRVGEIHLELPDGDAVFDDAPGASPKGGAGAGGLAGTKPQGKMLLGRKGMLAVAGIFAFALCFALGLAVAIRVVKNTAPGTEEGRDGEVAAGPAQPPERAFRRPENPPASAPARPPPEAISEKSRATAVTPPPEPATRKPPPPEPAEVVTPAGGQKAAAPAGSEEAPGATSSSAISPVPVEDVQAAVERRRYLTDLLQRARELVKGGDILSARNIFESVKDWGDLSPQAMRVRLMVLLAANPPGEAEALDLLRQTCAAPSASGSGGACELLYVEAFAYAGKAPGVGAGPATWERKIEFLKSAGVPPAALQDGLRAHAAACEQLHRGYLAFLAAAAGKCLREEDVPGARKALDRAARFAADEKIAGVFPRESALLESHRRRAADLESEIAEWRGLAPLYPSADAQLSKLAETDLQDRLEKFASFARKHPGSPRKVTAEIYRGRYQEDLDRRGKK